MKRSLLAGLLAAAALAVAAQAQADPLDGHDCFSRDNERRISGCSQLIETPGLDRDTLARALAMRALALSLKGQYDAAIRDYDSSIQLRPDFAVALNNRAWAYFKSGRASQGLPDVELSLRLDPGSPHAYDTRAHIRQQRGETEGALADYHTAMMLGGQRMVQLYQCGLQAAGLYKGPLNGYDSPMLRAALRACVKLVTCDPLPADEECRLATS